MVAEEDEVNVTSSTPGIHGLKLYDYCAMRLISKKKDTF